MSYDLRRLRLHGLIQRIPGTHTYTITSDGARVAIFYTKLQHRLLGPSSAPAARPRHLNCAAAPQPESRPPVQDIVIEKTTRQAAYDLCILRGKQLIDKPGRTRRYRAPPAGACTITALLALRDHVIAPILVGVRSPGWAATQDLDRRRP